MIEPDDTAARLTQLEIKASFSEDLLDKLDQIVTRQQDQLDRLHRELSYLRLQLGSDSSTAAGNLRDELPPHY